MRKGAFLGVVSIDMTPGDDGRQWRVNAPLAYVSREDGPGRGAVIRIEPGLPTDGASIPRFFWRLIGCPLRGRHAPAALMHDGLYAAQYLPRDVADGLLREALLAVGVGRLKTAAMYYAVRLGGGLPWRRQGAAAVFAASAHVHVER